MGHQKQGVGTWILGGIVGIGALIGLVMAAKAHDSTFYGIGLALFAFCCGFVFFLIKRSFDVKQ